jgi:hypothetical protein
VVTVADDVAGAAAVSVVATAAALTKLLNSGNARRAISLIKSF